MGFIQKDDDKIDLVAYLTQEARNNVLNGEKEDFQIEYYSLCDPDTNYYASGANNAPLRTGFVSDLTGDHTGVIKSMAAGTLNQKNFIKGTNSSVGIPGTDGNIGSEQVKVAITSIGNVGVTNNNQGGTITFNETGTATSTKSYRIPIVFGTKNDTDTITSYSNLRNNIKFLVTIESVNITSSNTQNEVAKNFYKNLLFDSLFFYDKYNNNKSKSIVVDCKKEIDTINITRDIIIAFQDLSYSYYGLNTGNLYGTPANTFVLNYIPDGYSVTVSIKPLSFINTNFNTNTNLVFTIPTNNKLYIANQVATTRVLSNDYLISTVDNSSIIPAKFSNNLALKKIEKNGDGGLGFEKTITTGIFSNETPLFLTKADLTDKTNPKLNLFSTFNLPSSNQEFANLRNKYQNTGLYPLFFDSSGNTNNKILIGSLSDPITPSNNYYGELVDAKTFNFNFSYYDSNFTASTIYASYFYTGGDLPNFNTLYSDPNSFSSQFSNVEPNKTNDYNSNVAYLFCNQISKPKTSSSYVRSLVYSSTSLTLTPDGSIYRLPLSGLTNAGLNTNDRLVVVINSATLGISNGIINFGNSVNILDANDVNIGQTIEIPEDPNDEQSQAYTSYNNITIFQNEIPKTFYLKNIIPGTSNLFLQQSPVNERGEPSNGTLSLNISIYKLKIDNSLNTTNLWNEWSVSNKFSRDKNNNTGKMWATFSGTSYDEPVGIIYLDKGFFIITNQFLVNKFATSSFTYQGYADDTSIAANVGDPVNSGFNTSPNIIYTNISDNAASMSCYYKYITSEFTQNIYCLSLGDEHTISSNPTFLPAYQDTPLSSKKVVATEIGLYNKFGKLVALAKTSEPIIKNPGDINVFQITLKL
jgi:hypothetical protein